MTEQTEPLNTISHRSHRIDWEDGPVQALVKRPEHHKAESASQSSSFDRYGKAILKSAPIPRPSRHDNGLLHRNMSGCSRVSHRADPQIPEFASATMASARRVRVHTFGGRKQQRCLGGRLDSLPVLARDPWLGDALAEEFIVELERAWSVDARDVVYADEKDPLDLYHTILRLNELRRPVFSDIIPRRDPG